MITVMEPKPASITMLNAKPEPTSRTFSIHEVAAALWSCGRVGEYRALSAYITQRDAQYDQLLDAQAEIDRLNRHIEQLNNEYTPE